MCADLAPSRPRERTEVIRGRLTTLERYGIAAEPFPSYVNPVLDLHGLDVVLLTFVLAGTGRHVIGNRQYAVTEPSVGITRTGEQHSLVTGEDRLDVVNVYLDVEYHPLPTLSAPHDVALAALLPFSGAVGPHRQHLSRVPLPNIVEISQILTLLVEESKGVRPGCGDALDGLRKLLLTACARAIVDTGLVPSNDVPGSVESAIRLVCRHLERTYVEHHTLESLAAMANLEKTYFSRMFTVHTGLPMTEYLSRLRIRYAITQLRGTTRAVAEISASSGFRDLSHFGRTFRKYTGVTPGEYRRSGPRPASSG